MINKILNLEGLGKPDLNGENMKTDENNLEKNLVSCIGFCMNCEAIRNPLTGKYVQKGEEGYENLFKKYEREFSHGYCSEVCKQEVKRKILEEYRKEKEVEKNE